MNTQVETFKLIFPKSGKIWGKCTGWVGGGLCKHGWGGQ